MTPQEILALLIEASTADPKRANKIGCILTESTAALGPDGVFEIDSPAAGIHLCVEALYFKLCRDNPQLLPSMLPFFDMACGERNPDSLLKV
jgi:hypothetical protein